MEHVTRLQRLRDQPGELRVRHGDFAPLVTRLSARAAPTERTLVLEPGREVYVALTDELGTPLRGARIDLGAGFARGLEEVEPGVYRLSGAPPGQAVYSAALGARRYELRSSAPGGVAALVAPAHGEVAVARDAVDLSEPGSAAVLALYPVVDGRVELQADTQLLHPGESGEFRVQALAGEYRALLARGVA